jgi:hypothetical protein
MGAIHNKPDYAATWRAGPQTGGTRMETDDLATEAGQRVVYVNCPFTPQKVNYPFLVALRDIVSRVKSKVVFRFFPNIKVSVTPEASAFIDDVDCETTCMIKIILVSTVYYLLY